MNRCEHVFKSSGEYYRRRKWILGGDLFTVVRYKKCVHCNKTERKVEMKKHVKISADKFERQLRFSGVKPEDQTN